MAEYFRLRNCIGEIRRLYGRISEGMKGRKRKGGELKKILAVKTVPGMLQIIPGNVPSVITLWGMGLEFTTRWLVELNFLPMGPK